MTEKEELEEFLRHVPLVIPEIEELAPVLIENEHELREYLREHCLDERFWMDEYTYGNAFIKIKWPTL